jgi:hypothetical protein
MSLIDQLDGYTAGKAVETQATRAVQQASNLINSALADYAVWAATIPSLGFDDDTLAAIEARKQAIVTAALAALGDAVTAIESL